MDGGTKLPLSKVGPHVPDAYSITRRWPTGTEYALGKSNSNDTGVPNPRACALAAARAVGLPTLTVEGGTVGFVTVTGSGVLPTVTLTPSGGPAALDCR